MSLTPHPRDSRTFQGTHMASLHKEQLCTDRHFYHLWWQGERFCSCYTVGVKEQQSDCSLICWLVTSGGENHSDCLREGPGRLPFLIATHLAIQLVWCKIELKEIVSSLSIGSDENQTFFPGRRWENPLFPGSLAIYIVFSGVTRLYIK